MFTINEITVDHIAQLSPKQLSKLLHLLLRIEAQKNSLEDWRVLVPQKINVADGGEDGRIEWAGNPKSTDWLKNKLTIFQCKATDLKPSQCYAEILETVITGKSRKLKSQLEEIVKNNGCYTLFTKQDLNTLQKKERIKEFRRALQDAKHATYESFDIRIYDANEIKDWTNENIAAVTFVQACVGIKRLTSFRIWNEWEKDMPGAQIPYQTNDTIINNIKQIRTALKTEKVIRIIGHSGLGKTRLVLETFRAENDQPEIKALQAHLVYYDMNIGNIDDIANYVISHRHHQAAIIVIDNCDEDSHNIVSGLVNISGNFKIITIDFSSKTEARSVIKLDRENQRDIVQKIVEEKFHSTISQTDKKFISNQSEGYPQMAILFSKSVHAGGFDKLNNTLPQDFIKKLVFGREKHSDFEFEIIKACSIVSNFGFIDDSISSLLTSEEKESAKKQADYIRLRICGKIEGKEVTAKEFYRVILKYKESNIIEQRGTRVMVKPTPLAINLAALWWKETPNEEIKEILNELNNEELGKRLVERLTELDQLDKAKEIVNELWGPDSPFGTAEVLNTSLGSLLFRYVVEVNPIATANTLETVFGHLQKDEILKIEDGRRNLVWALEKLCFRKETFNTAAKTLFSFAVAENETWANNSTNQFIHLFQIILAGTEANLKERLEIIYWGLNKDDANYTKIAISALGQGLLGDRFSRTGSAENQGSGAPLVDYHPEREEVTKYWEEILNILTEYACSDTSFSELAKHKISISIRTLIRNGLFDLAENSIHKIIANKGNLWVDALDSLKMTLASEKNLPDMVVQRIKALIKRLTPTDIKNQLLLKVTKPLWVSREKDENGFYIDMPKIQAESFAEYLIKNGIPWTENIQDLLQGEQRQGYYFGFKYGELVENKENIIQTTLKALKAIKKEDQNPEFLAGLLNGTKDKRLFEKVIDEVIDDDNLRQHAFYLTRIMTPTTYTDIAKLFLLIDKYGYSVTEFQILHYGSALNSISKTDLINLLEKISKYGVVGMWTSLSLYYMYNFNKKEIDENWQKGKTFIKNLISNENLIIARDAVRNIEGHYWSDTVIDLLNDGKEEEFAKTIASQIVEFCSQPEFDYDLDIYVSNVVLALLEKYFDSIWEHLGKGLIGDYRTFTYLDHMVGTRNGYLGARLGMIFRYPDKYDLIINWCKEHPRKAPSRIAHIMPLDVTENKKTRWHPFSKLMIDEFGDDDEFLKSLSCNMGTFGTVGSRVPYFVTQKKLLAILVDHKIERVNEWAKRKLQDTEKIIKRKKLDDEEEQIR